MTVTRRSLLAAPALLAASAPSPIVLDALSPGRVILRRVGQTDGLILPATRARPLANFVLDGNDIAGTVFATDPDATTAIDLLAITLLPASGPPRLIGLEVFAYADTSGARLHSRCAVTSDRTRVVLSRTGAAAAGPTLVTRTAWIDYLVWVDGAPLADAAIHPQPPRSWAAVLALRRSRVRIALAGEVAEVTPALMDLCGLRAPLPRETDSGGRADGSRPL